MSVADEGQLDPATVAGLYRDHADELRRFLVGVLRDAHLAADVLQTTFAKVIEQGHATRCESRKAWLFQVAYHEALAIRRRQAVQRRAVERVAWRLLNESDAASQGTDQLVRSEAVLAVREALNELPSDQRQVVEMRIYQEKTFAVIASELKIPLGTALGRMRGALEKLRVRLRRIADERE